ncbi:MAG: ankyrin repeat domain-containing protein [Anaerolineales bacterium]|nr:ankyrin repeat domain-containing protein [Anaerolineales bacterium]
MSIEFFDAIKQGNLDEVQRLLSLNSSLIHEREEGLSPVMVAAYNHKPKVTDFLSDKAGSLNIFEAAATGKTNQIVRHLARDPMLVNAYACDGFQPLGLACFFGHYNTAEYLIKAGAQINTPSHNSFGVAPIQSAASAGHVKIVMLLLNNNANPNVRENNGLTPLHAAAQNGNAQMIRSLLFNGADLTIRSHSGKMPIDMALDVGNAEAAALLKEGITRRFRENRVQLDIQ